MNLDELLLLRLGEREGAGSPTTRRVRRDQHGRAPRLWEEAEHNETHVQRKLVSLLPSHAVEALVERWGDRFTGQDELGRVILVTAEAEGSVHHARVMELGDAHPRDVTPKLRELVRKGLLGSSGKTRATTYRPLGHTALPLFAASGSASSPHSEEGTQRVARPPADAAIIDMPSRRLPSVARERPGAWTFSPLGEEPLPPLPRRRRGAGTALRRSAQPPGTSLPYAAYGARRTNPCVLIT